MEDANLPENDEIKGIIKEHWAVLIEKCNLKKVYECKNHSPYVKYKFGDFFIQIGLYPVSTLTGWYIRHWECVEWPYDGQIEMRGSWQDQVSGVADFFQEYKQANGIL